MKVRFVLIFCDVETDGSGSIIPYLLVIVQIRNPFLFQTWKDGNDAKKDDDDSKKGWSNFGVVKSHIREHRAISEKNTFYST